MMICVESRHEPPSPQEYSLWPVFLRLAPRLFEKISSGYSYNYAFFVSHASSAFKPSTVVTAYSCLKTAVRFKLSARIASTPETFFVERFSASGIVGTTRRAVRLLVFVATADQIFFMRPFHSFVFPLVRSEEHT